MTLEQIKAKFRRLTFKRMNATLTDREQSWLALATSKFYSRFGRYTSQDQVNKLTSKTIERLSE